MNDDERKLLTEYLGECWHKPTMAFYGRRNPDDNHYYIECVQCRTRLSSWISAAISLSEYERLKALPVGEHWLRTFTTFQDLGELAKVMVKKGDWPAFYFWANRQIDNLMTDEFTAWLITDPARFCQLAADWLKEGKG